jgi:hypothetical protein
MRIALAVATTMLIAAPAHAATLAKSTFDTGFEHWMFELKPQAENLTFGNATFNTAIGNPGGGIRVTVSNKADYLLDFLAPDKFRGDQHAAYKGEVDFDLKWDRTGATTENTVSDLTIVAVGKNDETLHQTRPGAASPDGIYHRYDFSLAKNDWKDAADAPVTGAQLKNVLAHLHELRIRVHDAGTLGATGTSVVALDNVKLKTP